MNFALFDFDGTISSRDSFLRFMWYAERGGLIRTCFSQIPQVILYKLKAYPNQKLKETFLKQLFEGKLLRDLQTVSENYCREVVPKILRPGFHKTLDWHRGRGDEIVVVSATPAFILEPWCRTHGIGIIGTEVETDKNGRLTGRIIGRNSMGEEKVSRIKELYDLEEYDDLFAYGDTASDLPMLDLAPPVNRFYKPFR